MSVALASGLGTAAAMALLALTATVLAGIYPKGHFDVVCPSAPLERPRQPPATSLGLLHSRCTHRFPISAQLCYWCDAQAKKVTTDNVDGFIKEQVDAGKTLFIRWIASEG